MSGWLQHAFRSNTRAHTHTHMFLVCVRRAKRPCRSSWPPRLMRPCCSISTVPYENERRHEENWESAISPLIHPSEGVLVTHASCCTWALGQCKLTTHCPGRAHERCCACAAGKSLLGALTSRCEGLMCGLKHQGWLSFWSLALSSTSVWPARA